jgi:hypothetical protein
VTSSTTSSSSSRMQVLSGMGQSCAVKRPGFAATAGAILREEGPTAFTRGIQVRLSRAGPNIMCD